MAKTVFGGDSDNEFVFMSGTRIGGGPEVMPLSVPELRRLAWWLVWGRRARPAAPIWGWSRWRWGRQAVARRSQPASSANGPKNELSDRFALRAFLEWLNHAPPGEQEKLSCGPKGSGFRSGLIT